LLFNSIDFIIFFIIVLAIVAIYKNRNFQHFFLLGASYFFFYFSSNYLISLLIVSTLLDYYLGRAIWNSESVRRKKMLLATSLAGNLGLLGFFKYANFGIDQINSITTSLGFESGLNNLDIVLPIGISFYTFQTISYTVDIYRGKLSPCNSLKEFALFVTFFPQLVAGPIVRAHQFLPQLREKIEILDFRNNLRQIIIHNSNMKLGITIMAIGFLKKMFFADNIAPLVNDVFSNPIGLSSFTLWLGSAAFYFQLYGDFSGYTDIAIGAALILGFKLPINFNHPFFARSPEDWIKRWHISMFSWFKDYLYIPLGGSAKGELRTYLNLFLVMTVSGLWHGASWNFVIWGLLLGVYLTVHKIISLRFPKLKNHSFFNRKVGIIFSIFVTQCLFLLQAPAFRANNIEGILYSMQKMIFLDFAFESTFITVLDYPFEVFLMGLFYVLSFLFYMKPNYAKIISNSKYWLIFLLSIILAILFFYDSNPIDFIYFRF